MSKHSIPKQMFFKPKSSREFTEDIQPKFMGFLNENQQNKYRSDRPNRDTLFQLGNNDSVSK